MRCAHCKQSHAAVAQVRACAEVYNRDAPRPVVQFRPVPSRRPRFSAAPGQSVTEQMAARGRAKATPKYDLPWNPWRVLDERRARMLPVSERDMEKAIVRQQYKGAPEPMPCPRESCKSRVFWRVTVGAHQCPECRAMVTSSGRVHLDVAGQTDWLGSDLSAMGRRD